MSDFCSPEWMLKVIPNFNNEMESVTDDRSMSGQMWSHIHLKFASSDFFHTN